MGAFIPSKYQRAVYIYIEKGKGNAVIDAVAGSGKSTTIVNALKLIPKNKRVLFLAFNKAIVKAGRCGYYLRYELCGGGVVEWAAFHF